MKTQRRSRLLTVRPLNPEALQSFVKALKSALEECPIRVDDLAPWTISDLDIFQPVLDTYEEDFAATIAADKEARATKTWESSTRATSGSMAVLGLPLLAHLAIRLIAQWPGDPIEIIRNPKNAYLESVDFSNSCCTAARFDKAHLRNAKFEVADLNYTSFDNADVRDADFAGAIIYGSTSFEEAQIDNATLDLSTRIPSHVAQKIDTLES